MIFCEKFYESTGFMGVLIFVVWCTYNLVLPAIVDCLIKVIPEIWKKKEEALKVKLSYMLGILIAIFLLGSVKFFGDNMLADGMEQGQEQTQEQEPQRSIEYYIINAEHEIYSYDEINALSSEELYKLRNGIYARRGLHYKGVLGVYYEEFDWYNPQHNSEDEVSKYITYNEWRLIDLVKRIEEDRKGVN